MQARDSNRGADTSLGDIAKPTYTNDNIHGSADENGNNSNNQVIPRNNGFISRDHL